MRVDDEICIKFPAVFRDKLLNNEIEFPDETEFEYERLLTYRAVERAKDDFHKVSSADFQSYFDLNKKPRGYIGDITKDPEYYGASSFLKKEIVEQKMSFPNPNKKMAKGYIYKEGGPQHTNHKTCHVCWWLYEGTEVDSFELMEE